ncbi:hypothetical protein IB257_06165 [Achromobacter sp. ACM03]|uniref:hypothetical protein n=1 Tax=Achromobacter sp. ACM03 TaxID=2769300 RepID=UPI0017808905|nr:hypothetical protein [Achromobacter sp. ACM03]MBD9429513.1 hypothetical protein [Achromobacter sp. ACM03]
MQDWLTNISSISSILGLIITVFLFIEARKIRGSFIRRARLPELNKELAKMTSEVSKHLKNWGVDKAPALESFSKVKALLENIEPKLPTEERKKVLIFLSRLEPRKYFFIKANIAQMSEDSVWNLYTDLSGLVTSLEQIIKDSKWD